jgi:hypothetical protein
MLMAGKQVTQVGDQLTAVSIERVFLGIKKTEGPVADLVYQLRALKSMQPLAYRRAKTQLPYIVCGTFTPALRRKENFAFAEHFMLDIDKLSSLGLSIAEVKNKLAKDSRVSLLFISPGNDGLKVLFNLQDKIYDAGYYSTFYKRFAAQFATEFGLQGAVDLVTSDVSRCCFMSCDADAYYNEKAEPIDATAWVNPNNLQALDLLKAEIKQVEETAKLKEDKAMQPEPNITELPTDILSRIKEKLEIGRLHANPKEKDYIQPAQLDEAMPALQLALTDLSIELVAQKPIQYGRQLKIKAGPHWAEVNLFYGKAGFRAVQTTKTGSHKGLAELGTKAIQQHFDNLINLPL